MMVCSLLAPIFSTVVLTSEAIFAIASIPSSENSRSTFSVFSKATYCLISADLGWVNILIKSLVLVCLIQLELGNGLEAQESFQMAYLYEKLQPQ